MQQRHVSALFYGAIFRSSIFTKEEIQQTVAYTTNFFIGLNMQQRRHVSAIFYGTTFRSSTFTKEEIQQTPWEGALHCG